MLYLKNGNSSIVIDGERKGGGWFEFQITVNGKQLEPRKKHGAEAAHKYLAAGLDWAFSNGYRLVNEKGKALPPVRLENEMVATLAEAVAKGAAPQGVAAKVEECKGKPLTPRERQALISCAVATAQRFQVEGGVNRRWRVMPEIDAALLAALVPA